MQTTYGVCVACIIPALLHTWIKPSDLRPRVCQIFTHYQLCKSVQLQIHELSHNPGEYHERLVVLIFKLRVVQFKK